MSRLIRVDNEVYASLLAIKSRLEALANRPASWSKAVGIAIAEAKEQVADPPQTGEEEMP